MWRFNPDRICNAFFWTITPWPREYEERLPADLEDAKRGRLPASRAKSAHVLSVYGWASLIAAIPLPGAPILMDRLRLLASSVSVVIRAGGRGGRHGIYLPCACTLDNIPLFP